MDIILSNQKDILIITTDGTISKTPNHLVSLGGTIYSLYFTQGSIVSTQFIDIYDFATGLLIGQIEEPSSVISGGDLSDVLDFYLFETLFESSVVAAEGHIINYHQDIYDLLKNGDAAYSVSVID